MHLTDKESKKNIDQIVWPTIIFLCLFVSYYFYHHKIQNISSDVTTMFPLLRDWLSGNVLLQDWIVGTNSFFFTDTIWCIPGELIGLEPAQTMSWAGALFHAGFVSLTFYVFLVTKEPLDNESKITRAIYCVSYVLIAATVPGSALYVYLNLNGHAGAFFVIAIEFLVLHIWSNSRSEKILWLAIYTVFGALIEASDGVSLMILFGPACVYSIYYLIWPKVEKNRNKYLSLLISNIAVIVGGTLFNLLIESLGGLTVRGISMELLSSSEAVDRVWPFIEQIYSLLGFYVSMWQTNFLYALLVHCILLLIVFSVIWQLFKAISGKPDSKGLLLSIAILANTAGCLFTGVAVVARYILTIPFFGVVLIFRTFREARASCKCCSKGKKAERFTSVVMACLAFFFFAANFNTASTTNQNSLDAEEMANYIEERNLGNGYGDFWTASLVSSYTDFDDLVIQVYSNSNGFAEYPELVSTKWYGEDDIHYVLFYEDDTKNSMCRESDVTEFLGEPDQDVIIGAYELLYYQEDISEYLLSDA